MTCIYGRRVNPPAGLRIFCGSSRDIHLADNWTDALNTVTASAATGFHTGFIICQRTTALTEVAHVFSFSKARLKTLFLSTNRALNTYASAVCYTKLLCKNQHKKYHPRFLCIQRSEWIIFPNHPLYLSYFLETLTPAQIMTVYIDASMTVPAQTRALAILREPAPVAIDRCRQIIPFFSAQATSCHQ